MQGSRTTVGSWPAPFAQRHVATPAERVQNKRSVPWEVSVCAGGAHRAEVTVQSPREGSPFAHANLVHSGKARSAEDKSYSTPL
jgi:hypothetical protein